MRLAVSVDSSDRYGCWFGRKGLHVGMLVLMLMPKTRNDVRQIVLNDLGWKGLFLPFKRKPFLSTSMPWYVSLYLQSPLPPPGANFE